MNFVNRFIEQAKLKRKTIVLPEGNDARIVAAARKLADDRIATPILLGADDAVRTAAAEANVSLDGLTVIDPKRSDKLDAYVAAYIRGRDDISEKVAHRLVSKPLYFGGMMLASGDADAYVGGAASATSSVIQAGALTVGYAPGISTPSSFFLMIIPDFNGEKDKPFIYADCAVNIQPTASQLADIAIASAMSGSKLLSEPPRVALLSFSTDGSASHPDVDKITEALHIVQDHAPDIFIDGEFQADSAIVPRVAAKKVKHASEVAGRANVLVFPDLDAGNVAYKLTQYMANARAIGPLLQGFAKPVSDLSRGATVEDIVATSAILSVMC